MKNEEFKNNLISIFTFVAFSFVFFAPRYFSHSQYDALEDEILAIGNNQMNSVDKLIFAPDFTHPQIWYILMDLPTTILGLDHGIFYYRLIQVIILFCSLIFIYFYFKTKLTKDFLISFYLLFLSNIYLVHLTTQHRMYSLVLSVAIFYSFYWYDLIKNDKDKFYKNFITSSLIAALGFFINYSMIWIIPVWPLAYLLYRKNFDSLKKILVFSLVFLGSISWFIPTFIVNSTKSIVLNQWASDLTLTNALQLFGNYFGLIPIQEKLNLVNPLLIPLIFLITLFVNKVKKSGKAPFISKIFIASVFSLFLFLLTVYITKNSLLYPRPSITLIVAFYTIFAIGFSLLNKSRIFIYILLVFQLSQHALYYFQDREFSLSYFFVDYKKNTISYFKDYSFLEKSCLIPIPNWNTNAAKFFLQGVVEIIPVDRINYSQVKGSLEPCSNSYLLEQQSIDATIIEDHRQKFFNDEFEYQFLENFENQNLYLLTKKEL